MRSAHCCFSMSARDKRNIRMRRSKRPDFLRAPPGTGRCRRFPSSIPSNGDRSRALAYFFDCGIIVRGLLAAWRASKEPEFRDTAIAAGRAMMTDFQRAARSIRSSLCRRNSRLAYEPRWSASPGCYQLKSAMAWQELFEATGEMEFFRAYESAVAAALASECDFLPGETNREKVMDRLHAYAYFLEGLLPMLHRVRLRTRVPRGDRPGRLLICARSHRYLPGPMFTRNCCGRGCSARLGRGPAGSCRRGARGRPGGCISGIVRKTLASRADFYSEGNAAKRCRS